MSERDLDGSLGDCTVGAVLLRTPEYRQLLFIHNGYSLTSKKLQDFDKRSLNTCYCSGVRFYKERCLACVRIKASHNSTSMHKTIV